jgi:hypothetical protein
LKKVLCSRLLLVIGASRSTSFATCTSCTSMAQCLNPQRWGQLPARQPCTIHQTHRIPSLACSSWRPGGRALHGQGPHHTCPLQQAPVRRQRVTPAAAAVAAPEMLLEKGGPGAVYGNGSVAKVGRAAAGASSRRGLWQRQTASKQTH